MEEEPVAESNQAVRESLATSLAESVDACGFAGTWHATPLAGRRRKFCAQRRTLSRSQRRICVSSSCSLSKKTRYGAC